MNTLTKQYIFEYTYPLCSELYNGSCIYIVIDKMRYYIKSNKEKYMNLSRNRCYNYLKSVFGLHSVFSCGDMVGNASIVSYIAWYGTTVVYNTSRHYSIVQEDGVTVRTVGK